MVRPSLLACCSLLENSYKNSFIYDYAMLDFFSFVVINNYMFPRNNYLISPMYTIMKKIAIYVNGILYLVAGNMTHNV